jgi:tRNA nucleotidyltransferase (CCA-adding enzyme)
MFLLQVAVTLIFIIHTENSQGISLCLRAGKVRKLVIWHKLNFKDSKVSYHIVYFGALFYGEPLKKVEGYLKELSFPSKEAQEILDIVREVPEYVKRLREAEFPCEVYKLLRNRRDEFLLLLSAVSGEQEKVVFHMKEYRYVKPLISGKDLKNLGLKPGPVFREVLDRIKCEIIDGKLPADNYSEQLSRLKEILSNGKVVEKP